MASATAMPTATLKLNTTIAAPAFHKLVILLSGRPQRDVAVNAAQI